MYTVICDLARIGEHAIEVFGKPRRFHGKSCMLCTWKTRGNVRKTTLAETDDAAESGGIINRAKDEQKGKGKRDFVFPASDDMFAAARNHRARRGLFVYNPDTEGSKESIELMAQMFTHGFLYQSIRVVSTDDIRASGGTASALRWLLHEATEGDSVVLCTSGVPHMQITNEIQDGVSFIRLHELADNEQCDEQIKQSNNYDNKARLCATSKDPFFRALHETLHGSSLRVRVSELGHKITRTKWVFNKDHFFAMR